MCIKYKSNNILLFHLDRVGEDQSTASDENDVDWTPNVAYGTVAVERPNAVCYSDYNADHIKLLAKFYLLYRFCNSDVHVMQERGYSLQQLIALVLLDIHYSTVTECVQCSYHNHT